MAKNKHNKPSYRLTILNDNTLDTEYTTRFTRLKVSLMLGGFVVVVCFLFYVILFATPIRHILPGYLDPELKQQMMVDAFRMDSLSEQLDKQEHYLTLVRSMVSGTYIMDTTVSMDTLAARQEAIAGPSEAEKQFRAQYEESEKYNLSMIVPKPSTDGLLFYPPLKGSIDSLFNEKEQHYGIDIMAPRRQPVLSVLDGRVVFAGYTQTDGYVVMIQHNNDFISVYREMSESLKNTGSQVKAGEPIAFVGRDTGKEARPHLHFELWYKGLPLNPEDYILFQ